MNIDLGTVSGKGFHVTLDKGVNTVTWECPNGFARSQLKVAHDPDSKGYSKVNSMTENRETGAFVGEESFTSDGGNVRGLKIYKTPPAKYQTTLNCSAAISCALVPYHLKAVTAPPKSTR